MAPTTATNSAAQSPATEAVVSVARAVDDTVVLGPWVEIRIETGPHSRGRVVAVNHRNGRIVQLDHSGTPWSCRRELVRLLGENGCIAAGSGDESAAHFGVRLPG